MANDKPVAIYYDERPRRPTTCLACSMSRLRKPLRATMDRALRRSR